MDSSSFSIPQSSTCDPTETPTDDVPVTPFPDRTIPNPPSDETLGIPAEEEAMKNSNKKKKKTKTKTKMALVESSSRGVRVASKRRSSRVMRRTAIADAVSFRLGMSIAAFVAEILERKVTLSETMLDDDLALICASAVKASLANDFGDTIDGFISNFEKSFQSTFKTLRLIKVSSMNKENSHINRLNVEEFTSDRAYNVQDSVAGRGNLSSFSTNGCQLQELFNPVASEDHVNQSEIIEDNYVPNPVGLELALHGQGNELTSVFPNPFRVEDNRSMLSTIEKSVLEQARSNDLKTLELNLTMKKMKMKETSLALHYDLNNLERSKLAMGVSKASFKAEKFKTQLGDVRHAELLRTCIDCLLAGLILMAGSLTYGAYLYSYQKITEATASCTPSKKDSKSWWFSNPMSTLNSGMQMLSCQFQVVTRMTFGVVIIFFIAYLLFQRSGSSKQTMPITFLVFLLAVLCGACGKFCVDTLGGSGFHWLIFWEMICLVHFLCNVFTPTLFYLLYGPVTPSPGTKFDNPRLPYWIRRVSFYSVMLVFLPLLCGLLPFASVGDWKDHFWFQIENYLSWNED